MRSKKFKMRALATLLCLMAFIVAACGSDGSSSPGGSTSNPNSNSGKATDDKQILRYPVVGPIATMDPALVQDVDSNFPIQNVFTGLIQLTGKLEVQDQLAKSHKVSDDGLTWTFTLKDGLKFSDGSPLTSDDVIYSIDRVVQPATKSQVSWYLSLIKGYKDVTDGKAKSLMETGGLAAPDPQTVVITIVRPAAYFLQTLSYPTSYVVNKKLIEKYQDKWTEHLEEGAGNGPWKVEKYDRKSVELIPNENYYGSKPQLKRISVVFFTNQDAMYSAYQANQLEYTPVPPANIELEKNNKGFRVVPYLAIRYVTMNYLIKPFDNIKIRQAFALAINKDLIAQSALRNAFKPTNHLLPEGMLGFHPELAGPAGVKGTAGDEAKAKQLLQEGLKEAGYNSINDLPPLELTYYPRNQQYKDAITICIQMWTTVLNVKVNVTTVERAKLLELTSNTKNNPNGLQMWQAGWISDYPDPQDWLSTFFAEGTDYNQFNYGQNNSTTTAKQKEAQEILLKADSTQDPAERVKLYNQAE